ncbi:hypothetical protein [Phaeobacter sp.]|uniref:hypothetical protein n=1 Tax=Phaeobacter sp. TaxID=1902409 RepID=UPI0025F5367F|nr:hypothetical protein [Phaeobacter sp.]
MPRPPYFALRNELEAAFQVIRSAYSHEPVAATEQDLTALSEAYFAQIEADAERNATELLGDPEAQRAALNNTLEDIAVIQNGDTSALGHLLSSKEQGLGCGHTGTCSGGLSI